MKFKTILSAFALTLIGSMALSAQNPKNDCPQNNCPASEQCAPDSCPHLKKQRPELPYAFKGLDLTDEQKAQLREICKPDNQKRSRGDAPYDGKRLEEIKKILTPEQYVTFLENMTKKKAERHGRPHGRMPRYPQGNPQAPNPNR